MRGRKSAATHFTAANRTTSNAKSAFRHSRDDVSISSRVLRWTGAPRSARPSRTTPAPRIRGLSAIPPSHGDTADHARAPAFSRSETAVPQRRRRARHGRRRGIGMVARISVALHPLLHRHITQRNHRLHGAQLAGFFHFGLLLCSGHGSSPATSRRMFSAASGSSGST